MAKLTLLDKFFSSPMQLLQKVEQEKELLRKAIERWDEPEIARLIFDCTVGAYHVRDWVKEMYPHLKDDANHLLNSDRNIKACRDLANASKHVTLDTTRTEYRRYAPAVDNTTVSAGPTVDMAFEPTRRVKVVFKDGKRVRIEEVVDEACRAWREFFAQHGIR